VPSAAFQAKPQGRADGTGRPEPPGAAVVKASEDAPSRVIRASLGGERLASEPCGVLVGQDLCQAGERAAATQRLEHEAQHEGARVHVHRCGYGVMDAANQAQLGSGGFANGQRVDGGHLDRRRDALQTSLSWGPWSARCCEDCNPPLVLASARPKCHEKKEA
jgi:hypothetical protein